MGPFAVSAQRLIPASPLPFSPPARIHSAHRSNKQAELLPTEGVQYPQNIKRSLAIVHMAHRQEKASNRILSAQPRSIFNFLAQTH
jgi:hypothetical protein